MCKDDIQTYEDWLQGQRKKAQDFYQNENKEIPPQDLIAYQHTLSIGGSMDASLLGLSKWNTPADVYNSFFNFKHGESKFVFDRGHALEPFVAEQFEKIIKKKVCNGITLNGKKFGQPWAFCQIDRMLLGITPVEIKVATYNTVDEDGHEWGTGCKFNENGDLLYEDDQIPKAYFAQCQKQLWLSEQEFMYLVVWLTAEIHVRVYKIYRNEDFIKLIQETERAFLFEHVIPQIPYETDFKPLSDEYSESTVFADSETIDAIEELQQLNLDITSLDKRKKQLTNLIKDKIGDYEACVDVQGNTLATLRRYSTRRFDFDALLNDHPEYAGYYKTNETTRLNLCKQKNI